MDPFIETPVPPVESTRFSWLRRRNIVVAGLFTIIAIAGIIYFLASGPTNPQKAAREEAEELVAAVSKLILLPEGELPIIATVADPSKLKDQPFFTKAKKGDKVLIFNAARKAILYDPEAQHIIDVAPLNIGTPTPTPKSR